MIVPKQPGFSSNRCIATGAHRFARRSIAVLAAALAGIGFAPGVLAQTLATSVLPLSIGSPTAVTSATSLNFGATVTTGSLSTSLNFVGLGTPVVVPAATVSTGSLSTSLNFVGLGTPVVVPAATVSTSSPSAGLTVGHVGNNLTVGAVNNLANTLGVIIAPIHIVAVPLANTDLVQLTAVPALTDTGPLPLFNGGQQAADMLTGMTQGGQALARSVLDDSCDPADCAAHTMGHGYTLHVWLRGLGGLGHLTGSNSRSSFSNSYGGALLGAAIGRAGVTVGAGTGYLRIATGFPDGRATQNAAVGFVYGQYAAGAWRLQAVAGYGGGTVEGSRVPQGTQLTAAGSRPGMLAVVQLQTAYALHLGRFTIEPQANFTYLHAGQGSFAESGAGLADLTYAATHADSASGGLAVRLTRQFTMSHWLIAPWVSVGLQQIFSGTARTVDVSDGAFSAQVAGVSPAPLSATMGAGAAIKVTAMLDVFAAYVGELSANQTQNAFDAGMTLRF